MPYRDAASFGKRQEFVAIAELLRRGFDVYLTLVDDMQIDCVIRQDVKGEPVYLDVQTKARSLRGSSNERCRVTFYCPRCVGEGGLTPAMPTTEFLATEYQRQKHRKHTVPSSSHRVQSVFDDPSKEYHVQTVQEAYQQGALEVTSRGTDILFCPSTEHLRVQAAVGLSCRPPRHGAGGENHRRP